METPITARRAAFVLAALLAVLGVGTIAFEYELHEGWLRSFYRAVATTSLAGLDTAPHGTWALITTMILVLAGVAIFGYVAAILVEVIARKLGNPTHDPHGDPIPTRELQIEETTTESLESLQTGARGTFVRVSDAEPEMLRYLAQRGIAPGDDLEVIDRQPFGGPLFVRFGRSVHALGGELAQAMRIEVAP